MSIETYVAATLAMLAGLWLGYWAGRHSARSELAEAKKHRAGAMFILKGIQERTRGVKGRTGEEVKG